MRYNGICRHLDADEAVVLGAGLFAANLSTTFRLRKFGMSDGATFPLIFQVTSPHTAGYKCPVPEILSLNDADFCLDRHHPQQATLRSHKGDLRVYT